jgi:hypothetical protein
MTYTLIGRCSSHRREVRIHQYIGDRPRYACCGWMSTVPVLKREIRVMRLLMARLLVLRM